MNTVSDNTHCIDLTYYINCHINSDLFSYIDFDSLLHINFDMIDVYNLSSTSHKMSSHTDFSFCKCCLSFVSMILACFAQNSDFSLMLL